MNTEEGRWEVNTESTEIQDNVLLVVGAWVRDPNGKWVFDPETTEGETFIQLHQGMTHTELLKEVKEKLKFRDGKICVKLSYQYPEWLEIDDADGSAPQYITDNDDVHVFMEMRRAIEEVNLFVSPSRFVGGVQTSILPTGKGNMPPHQNVADGNRETGEKLDDPDSGWHDFAISDTPLTLPEQTLGTTTSGFLPIPRPTTRRSNGVTIREGADTIPVRSPPHMAKEKRKAVASPEDTSSDSDDDDDYINDAGIQRELPRRGVRAVAGVRHRLFHADEECGGSQAENLQEPASLIDLDADGEDYPSYTHWDRFEEALHHLLSDFTTTPALFERDAPPVFDTGDYDGVDAAMADVPYEGDNLFVGRVYKSKIDCKIKIAIHAINRKFHFRTSRSTPKFMVMKCVDRTCNWRVYAVMLDSTGCFQIRQATLDHSCTVDSRRHYHRLATTQVIGEIMQSKFIGVKRGPSPGGIRKVLLDDYHVNVSYWKAWRARELAMEKLFGTVAGSYALLPAYLALLKTTNPGSLCFLEILENPIGGTRFKYCFIAYGASIQGYPFMRRVIVVDGTSLKGRYGGCLISACLQDANFQIYPLAFGIVDSENNDSWSWFFSKLSEIVGDAPDIVFVSDRHPSIYAGLENVYPLAHHAACTIHLWRNVRASYRPSRLAGMMGAAARAFTVTDFNKKFLEIQKLNPGCAAYLVDIGFQQWTRSHFKGRRYNIMDSNIAESWNDVLKEAREFPLICMLEYIRTAVMTWFALRQAKATTFNGTLTPHVRRLVEDTYNQSTVLAVRPISSDEFQVQSQVGECFTVKLLLGTCSCMQFQALGIPCVHAMASSSSIDLPSDLMVDPFYSVETWKRGYEGKIYPVPSVGSDAIGGAFRGELLPPSVRRPAGRPRQLRIRSRGEFKTQLKSTGRRCTRCRREGHNKASCRQAI